LFAKQIKTVALESAVLEEQFLESLSGETIAEGANIIYRTR